MMKFPRNNYRLKMIPIIMIILNHVLTLNNCNFLPNYTQLSLIRINEYKAYLIKSKYSYTKLDQLRHLSILCCYLWQRLQGANRIPAAVVTPAPKLSPSQEHLSSLKAGIFIHNPPVGKQFLVLLLGSSSIRVYYKKT